MPLCCPRTDLHTTLGTGTPDLAAADDLDGHRVGYLNRRSPTRCPTTDRRCRGSTATGPTIETYLRCDPDPQPTANERYRNNRIDRDQEVGDQEVGPGDSSPQARRRTGPVGRRTAARSSTGTPHRDSDTRRLRAPAPDGGARRCVCVWYPAVWVFQSSVTPAISVGAA